MAPYKVFVLATEDKASVEVLKREKKRARALLMFAANPLQTMRVFVRVVCNVQSKSIKRGKEPSRPRRKQTGESRQRAKRWKANKNKKLDNKIFFCLITLM